MRICQLALIGFVLLACAPGGGQAQPAAGQDRSTLIVNELVDQRNAAFNQLAACMADKKLAEAKVTAASKPAEAPK